MTRQLGTITRGLRTPIFSEGDDLVKIIPELLVDIAHNSKFEIRDKDVLAITESIVARTQGNYASIYDIETDIKNKLNGENQLGITFPILSRNRFATLLRGIARSVDELIIQLSYPADEVGNHLFPADLLFDKEVNPYQDVLDEKQFFDLFGKSEHPFTGMDYIETYRHIVEAEGTKCQIIFANDVTQILNYTKNVLTCDVHTRHQSKRLLKQKGGQIVLGLEDILNQPTFLHGYNQQFGLLGSNKASDERVKLFPRDCQVVVDKIAQRINELTGKQVEVMIYGDGAFKDPVGRIWELADPVVSPAYTQGLAGKPNEIKLKYLADNDYKNLSKEEQIEAINRRIKENKESEVAGEFKGQLGTTPRQLTDLLGSLADLTSGSGDKGTPVVYIQGYFDNFAD